MSPRAWYVLGQQFTDQHGGLLSAIHRETMEELPQSHSAGVVKFRLCIGPVQAASQLPPESTIRGGHLGACWERQAPGGRERGEASLSASPSWVLMPTPWLRWEGQWRCCLL